MTTKTKKVHAADQVDTAAITAAKEFTAAVFSNGAWDKATADSLAQARSKARELEKKAGNGKPALIHAVTNGKAILVPHEFGRGATPKAGKEGPALLAAKLPPVGKAAPKAKAPAKVKAAPAAKAPAKKAAAPKKPRGESKTEKVVALLLKGKSTRGEIAAAVEWPSIDLKAIAERKGLKLKTNAEGVITATGGQ